VNRVAARYPAGFLRSYVRLKMGTDPAYDAVFEKLRETTLPVLDVGCGVGVLALYLRDRGFTAPIVGIDHDTRKIDIARTVSGNEPGLSFSVADARSSTDFRGNVVLLDLLHYFTDEDQQVILRNVAAAGSMILIRDGIRDGSFRYRMTYAQETLARVGGWLRAERLNFPTRRSIESAFDGEFREDVQPMFGRTPFNNYLFAFKRSSSGMTNA